MKTALKQQLAAWGLTVGFLVFFPDPSKPPEIQDVTGLPAKVSKARIMRLKSQQVVRSKTKLNDVEDATAPAGEAEVDDELE